MKVAIKSKGRVERFRKKTYNQIIKKYDFDESLVHIFVSNDKDFNEYSVAYPKCKIVLAPDGIAEVDNFIVGYFDNGEEYAYMNDDVSGIFEMKSEKTVEPVEDLKALLNELLNECKTRGFTYGGFYPVCNPYYMKNQTEKRYDLSLILDPLSVCVNNKEVFLSTIPMVKPDGTLFIGESSDAEKCVKHYISKGGLVRFNRYAPKVEYFGKKGGFQGRDAFTAKVSAEFMVNKYPNHIAGYRVKKNGVCSIRFKNMNPKPKKPKKQKSKKSNGFIKPVHEIEKLKKFEEIPQILDS